MTEDQFRSIWTEAHNAGLHAVSSADPLDVSSPSPIRGFVWINIKPANSGFARFLTSSAIASHNPYFGGVSIWVHEFENRYDLKRIYAQAVSSHLFFTFKDLDPSIRVSHMSRTD